VSGEEKWNLNVRYVTQRPWGKGLARRQWSEYHRLLGKEAYAKGLPVGDGSAMKSVVAALGDVDGDSDLDLVIGRNGENLLYLNDGSARPFGDSAKGIPIGSNDEDATFSIGLVDMNGDGALDVVVGNYQSATRLYLNEGTERVFDGSDPGISIGGSDTAYASSIAVGDIDGDGDTDLVTGSFPYPRAPGKAGNRLYLNNGTAEPFSDIASGQLIGDDSNWTRSISLRDVDSDGDLDVISSGSGPTKLFVNDGDGQPFDSAGSGEQTRLVGTSESHEKTILVGDVNGDDAIDVIALGTAGVFMHLNSGGLHPFDSIENGLVLGEGLADQTQSVAVGDLDGDGDLDIVTGEGSRYLEHDSRTKVFLNRGFGTSSFLGFENTTIVGSEDKDDTHTVALGDLDGDGDLDIVAGSQFFTMVYLNDGGSRPFRGLKTGIPVGSELELNNRCIALGDIDGDGDLDLVGGNYGPDRIFFNDGDMETFGQRNAILGADDDKVSTRAIALGDVDGDGDIDIIAGGGNALCRLYLNDGDFDPFDGVGSGIAIGSSTKDIDALVLGDVDGDGDLDLIVADRRMRLYLNNGKSDPFRLSTPRVILSEGKTGRVRSLALGDVDGDGNVDLVVGHYRVNRVYLNNGRDVPFNRASVGTRAGRATDGKTLFVALGDLNGNGMLDLITGVDGENRVYLNEGDGTPFDGIVEKNLARRE
jgi:hypothetical protein